MRMRKGEPRRACARESPAHKVRLVYKASLVPSRPTHAPGRVTILVLRGNLGYATSAIGRLKFV